MEAESLSEILEADRLPRPKPNFYSAYRHRNKVRFVMDQLLATYGRNRSRTFLVATFGAFTWQRAVNATYGDDPTDVALSIVAYCIGKAFERVPESERSDALEALFSNDRSNIIADHVFRIVDMALVLRPNNRVFALTITYQAVGALQGLSENDRDDFVRNACLNHILELGKPGREQE